MKFYHGTSDALGIKGTLFPPSNTQVLREDFRIKLFNSVFLTISMKSAEMYAKKACKKYGGHPVVYIAKPNGKYIMNGTECICDSAKIIGVAT